MQEMLEMVSVETQTYDEKLYEAIKDAVSILDAEKFERNILYRINLESKWVDYIQFLMNGKGLNNAIDSLIGVYTSLADPYYPTLTRQSVAQIVQFLDSDWLEIIPDGENVVDVELCNAVRALVENKFSQREANLVQSFYLAMLQHEITNISGLYYQFKIQNREKKKRSLIQSPDGTYRINYQKQKNELAFQGATFKFVNIFNCYPDVFSPTFDTIQNNDILYREPTKFCDVITNDLYNYEAPYINEEMVIWRGSPKQREELKNLKDSGFVLPPAQVRLLQSSALKQNFQVFALKNTLDIRTCFLREFKVKQGNEDVSFENVIVIYAKGNGMIVPLLLEYNFREFNQKPLLLFEDPLWKNPYTPYTTSQTGMGYNTASYMQFMRAAQVYKAGKAMFPTEFIPSSLVVSLANTGVSPQQFKEKYQTPGSQMVYDDSIYQFGSEKIFTPEENRVLRDLQISQAQIDTRGRELSELNSDVSSSGIAQSTATGVQNIQSRQSAFERVLLTTVADQVLKPAVEFFIEDMEHLMQDEKVTIPFEEEELTEKYPEYSMDQLKQFTRETGSLLEEKKNVGNNQSMRISYDPVSMQKHYYLNKYLSMKGDIKIQIDNITFNRQERIADLDKLFMMVGQMPDMGDGLVKTQIIANLVEMYMGYTRNPMKASFTKQMKEMIQKQIEASQPDPAQQQAQLMQQQADAQNKQASAQQKEASAQHLQSQAAKTNQEVAINEGAKQLVGI